LPPNNQHNKQIKAGGTHRCRKKSDPGSNELHETIPGGECMLIRRVRPEDMGLYRDFVAGVSAEDLRLRFFGRNAELGPKT
jgi:hypothetical protein